MTKCEKLENLKTSILFLYNSRKDIHPESFKKKLNALRCELYKTIIQVKKAPCRKIKNQKKTHSA